MVTAGRDFEKMHDYIVGRLSDDERRAFEDRLVREPALVQELEESLRIREGLRRLRTQGYFARAASRSLGSLPWFPALAAAAVAGIALLLWAHRQGSALPHVLMSSPDSRGLSAGIKPFTFVPIRGEAVPDLDLPQAGLIEIRAAPLASRTDFTYRAVLLRRDSAGTPQSVSTLAAVVLSSDGYVHCFADASRLSAGSYLLRIEPENRAAESHDTPAESAVFEFNLRADGKRPSH